jgi:hypothetical protein
MKVLDVPVPAASTDPRPRAPPTPAARLSLSSSLGYASPRAATLVSRDTLSAPQLTCARRRVPSTHRPIADTCCRRAGRIAVANARKARARQGCASRVTSSSSRAARTPLASLCRLLVQHAHARRASVIAAGCARVLETGVGAAQRPGATQRGTRADIYTPGYLESPYRCSGIYFRTLERERPERQAPMAGHGAARVSTGARSDWTCNRSLRRCHTP